MKKLVGKIGLAGLVMGLLFSCASTSGAYKPFSNLPGTEIVGTVQATFVELLQSNKIVNEAAYRALLEAAKRENQGNIDVFDVTWSIVKANAGGPNRHEFSAKGTVVMIGVVTATNLETALESAATEIAAGFPARSRIAIVYIAAQDRSLTDYISGELEHLLRKQGCIIIDRSDLDRVRAEQQFGMSGEVDDNTAARIGNIAGAGIVITGRIDGDGNLRRLRLRALDTTSAQVVGTASERL